jgi:exodeoxyribonuclease V beta subunit
MLREHAFDSGCLFDEELQAEEAAMCRGRARLLAAAGHPLDNAALAGVLAQWEGVDALART